MLEEESVISFKAGEL